MEIKLIKHYILILNHQMKHLPDSKKLNTDIWYEEETYLWVKAAFDKTGYWEYRIKKVN